MSDMEPTIAIIKPIVRIICQRWPKVGVWLAASIFLFSFLHVQQVNVAVQTKDKGRFYMGWDYSQAAQATSAAKQHTPALPKVPKSPKRKKSVS